LASSADSSGGLKPGPGLLSATGPRGAAGAGDSTVWKNSVNPKYWWGIVAAVVVIVGAGLLVLKSRIPRVEPQRAVEEANRAQMDLQREVAHGKDLYAKGQYAESLALFRGILQRDPSLKVARDYSQMSEEAIKNEQQKKVDDDKTAQIAGHLQAGRSALDAKDFDTALKESEAVLDLDPKSEDGAKLSEETRKGLSDEKKAELRKNEKKKKSEILARAGQPQAKGSMPAPVLAPSASAHPAPTATTPATIRISFTSPIPKGYLMVAVNDAIVYRKNFDFGKENSGVVTDTLKVAPGSATVKVWLTTPDSSVKGYQPINATFAGGDSRVLTLSLQGKKFSAHLS
jgi:tetratricopeptide (TPR) repeat protein